MTETPLFLFVVTKHTSSSWPLTKGRGVPLLIVIIVIVAISSVCSLSHRDRIRLRSNRSGKKRRASQEVLEKVERRAIDGPSLPYSESSPERKPHLLRANAHDLFELDVCRRTPDPDVHLVRFHFKSALGGVPICQNARFQR
jgi:hypothetical protein